MADQLRTTFSEIADAIRTKSGTTEPISARNFASSILNLNAGGSKITVYTLIPPCTAVPVDSETMIENIYFNTSLSEAEVISIIDNAFASVPGWLEEIGPMTQVFMNESETTMIMVGIMNGLYVIQGFANNPKPNELEAILFVGGPNASAVGLELGFTGWNPNFSGSLFINETNAYVATMSANMGKLEQFQQVNEALKELISSTPF